MHETLKEINKNKNLKNKISLISNIYFNLSDISEDKENDYNKLLEVINGTDYLLIPAYPLSKSDDVKKYKFFIIRNTDLFVKEKTNKNLRLFATSDKIGKLVGNNGYNVNLIMEYCNSIFKKIKYQFPTIVDIEDRTLNNNYDDMKKVLKEIIKG